MAENRRLDINQRQDQILALVRERGFATIEMLADKFGVSQQTVRRDIIFLDDRNLLTRHHGGAGLPSGTDRLAYSSRKVRNSDEKQAIARAVARHIPDGSFLFIDIGTTTEAVARALVDHNNLRIITNHIDVVSILSEATDFEIILTGGIVRNHDRAVTGEATAEYLRKFRVGYGIFGIGSIGADGQLLDYDYRDAQASRAALEISRRKFVVADHSKFNADAQMPFAHASEVDCIFTDQQPAAEISTALTDAGAEIIIASD